jgi:acyl carrier protein
MGLDTVELIIAFEERSGVRIPNEVAAELYTQRRVTDYLMRTEVGVKMSREEIASIVREVIKDTTATTDFTDDSHFVDDLNLD